MKISKLTKRIDWLDVAKCFAILGVVIDHTKGILYQNQDIGWLSYFSVSLFIIVMGITTYWSLDKRKLPIRKILFNKSLGILIPYLVATFIYYIVHYGSFDFEKYIAYATYFNISTPFYYVLLYLQLVLVSPILYKLLNTKCNKKYQIFIEILFLITIVFISVLTTNYTNILSAYGGGGKLFGGTYLFLVYLGMWFAKYYKKINLNKFTSILVWAISTILTICWWRLISTHGNTIDSYVPFGGGLNPPSVSICTYAILIAISLYSFEQTLHHFKATKIRDVFSKIGYIGKHTLYIFLYHKLFLDFIFPFFAEKTGILIENIWCKRIVYLVLIIFGSILIEMMLKQIRLFVRSAYKDS